MFGEGVYLTDDGAKADQYTRAADRDIQTGDGPLAALHALLYSDEALPAAGVNYMFLCRVGLGCTIRTRDGKTCLDAGVATDDKLFAPSRMERRKQLGEIAGCKEPKVPYHSLLAELGGNSEMMELFPIIAQKKKKKKKKRGKSHGEGKRRSDALCFAFSLFASRFALARVFSSCRRARITAILPCSRTFLGAFFATFGSFLFVFSFIFNLLYR